MLNIDLGKMVIAPCGTAIACLNGGPATVHIFVVVDILTYLRALSLYTASSFVVWHKALAVEADWKGVGQLVSRGL